MVISSHYHEIVKAHVVVRFLPATNQQSSITSNHYMNSLRTFELWMVLANGFGLLGCRFVTCEPFLITMCSNHWGARSPVKPLWIWWWKSQRHSVAQNRVGGSNHGFAAAKVLWRLLQQSSCGCGGTAVAAVPSSKPVSWSPAWGHMVLAEHGNSRPPHRSCGSWVCRCGSSSSDCHETSIREPLNNTN